MKVINDQLWIYTLERYYNGKFQSHQKVLAEHFIQLLSPKIYKNGPTSCQVDELSYHPANTREDIRLNSTATDQNKPHGLQQLIRMKKQHSYCIKVALPLVKHSGRVCRVTPSLERTVACADS